MKRKYFVSLIFILSSHLLFGQHFFNKLHPGFDTYNIVELDSGYGTITIQVKQSGHLKFTMLKMDINGNLVDSFNLYKPLTALSTINNLFKTSDGNYMFFGTIVNCSRCYSGYLVKINSDFTDTLWTKVHEYPIPWGLPWESHYYHMIETKDKGLVGVGSVYENHKRGSYLVKMDSLGNMEWEQTIVDSFEIEAVSVVQCLDGGYLLGNITYKPPISQYFTDLDPIVIKTDSLGNVQWRKNLGSNFTDGPAFVSKTHDNKYLAIAGVETSLNRNFGNKRTRIQKFDLNGTVIWDKMIGAKDSSFFNPWSLYPVQNGTKGFIIGGIRGWSLALTNWNFLSYGLRIDANGDSLWFREFKVQTGNHSYDFNRLHKIIPTKDGGFIGSGSHFALNGAVYPNGAEFTWIIKMDSMGYSCDTPNCNGIRVGVDELNRDQSLFRVYPNPAKSQFTADFSRFNIKSGKIEIYNMQGKIIQEKPIYWGMRQSFFQVQDWQAGIYLIRLVSEGRQLAVKKIVVE